MIKIDYSNIKVGDSVYIVSDDSRETYYPRVAVVTNIGRKYITVKERPDSEWDRGIQFSKDNGIRKDWCQYRIYPNKDTYNKAKVFHEKCLYINRRIMYAMNDMSFDDIDQIYNIIKKYENK